MEHRKLCLVHCLYLRQKGLAGVRCRNLPRFDLTLLRMLICDHSGVRRRGEGSTGTRENRENRDEICREFTQLAPPLDVQGEVHYADGKVIYRNPATQTMDCYCVKNNRKVFRKLWSIPARPRWEDLAVISMRVPSGLYQPLPMSLPLHAHRPSVFVLRSDGRLQRYLINTGELKEEHLVSSLYKFTSITVDQERDWLILKSTRSPRSNTNHANSMTTANDVLMRFVIMQRAPLTFLHQFEVRKSVFGKAIKDVEVANGLLLCMSYKDKITAYSIDEVLRSPGKEEKGFVNEVAQGFPLNVKICSLPEPLLEVTAHNHNLQISENPWLYIKAFAEDCYSVHRLTDHTLVAELLLSRSVFADPDSVFFLPNETGQLAQTGQSGLKIFRVNKWEEIDSSLEEVMELSAQPGKEEENSIPLSSRVEFTRSGRKVLRIKPNYSEEALYHLTLDFEDELDIMVVLKSCESLTDDLNDGVEFLTTEIKELQLYDSYSFQLLKTFNIDNIAIRPGSDINKTISVIMDLDILIIKVKSNSKTLLYSYQLTASSTGREGGN